MVYRTIMCLLQLLHDFEALKTAMDHINNAAGPLILYYSFIGIPYYCTAMSIIIQKASLPTKLLHGYNMIGILIILYLAAYTSSKVRVREKGISIRYNIYS